MDGRAEIHAELDKAQQARARGNEGQARVCARRAAGLAIREYLARRGTPTKNASAIDLLHQLREDPAISPDLKSLIDHLTLRVDEEFSLPLAVDLIADAKQLCDMLAAS